MKLFLLISSFSLSLLSASTHGLQAQDAPPNPANNLVKQDPGNNSPSTYSPYNNALSTYPYSSPVYNQQGNNPYEAASVNYLLRAYNPQQTNSNQGKAVEYLLNGYYQLYQNANQQSGDQQHDANKDTYDVYLNQYIPQAANVYTQDNKGNYARGLQNYYQNLQYNDYYAQDPASSYLFLLNQQLGNVSKYWLGLQTGPLADDVRPFLDLPEGQGVVVMSVVDDSPAADAGLQVNDIVLSLGEKPVKEVSDLYQIVGEIEDAEAEMEIVRQGKPMTLKVQAQERPEPKKQEPNPDFSKLNYNPYQYMPHVYSPYSANLQDPRVEALQKQVKKLTERLEKLEAKVAK